MSLCKYCATQGPYRRVSKTPEWRCKNCKEEWDDQEAAIPFDEELAKAFPITRLSRWSDPEQGCEYQGCNIDTISLWRCRNVSDPVNDRLGLTVFACSVDHARLVFPSLKPNKLSTLLGQCTSIGRRSAMIVGVPLLLIVGFVFGVTIGGPYRLIRTMVNR